jgi:hypothetical protein
MQNFNWDKRRHTPEGSVQRGEDKLNVDELVPRFERQAIRDLDSGNAWFEIVRNITNRISGLVDDTEKERAAEDVVGTPTAQDYLKSEKGLADKKSQVAYVIALAKEIRKRKEKSN